MSTLSRWRKWWKEAGCKGDADKAFEGFMPLYCAPERFYHTSTHIEFCLDQLDRFVAYHEQEPFNKLAVEMAIWLHDAFIKVEEAEMHSAILAVKIAKRAKLNGDFTGVLFSCIESTNHSANGEGKKVSLETQVMNDIDLAILGQHRADYALYTLNIRKEYSQYNDRQFAGGRLKFMAGVLSKPTIYQTHFFFHKYETQARKNIREEITELMEQLK